MTAASFPKTKPDFPHYIDNSQITSFLACEELWKYEYLHRITRGGSIHLHAGKAYAAALETARFAFFRDHKSLGEALALGATTLIRTYGDFPCPTNVKKDLSRMLLAFDFYFHTWPPGTDFLQPIFVGGKHGIEFSFAIPLDDCPHPTTGDPILYSGRCDMLGRDESGSIFVEDDKTTTSLGANWLNRWPLASQFTGYVWAARQSFERVTGAIVRGVAIRTNDFDHAESIQYRSKWEITRWRQNTTSVIHRMIHAWKTDTYIYNLDKSCASFGGCKFQLLCTSRQPEKWFPDYEINTWSPIDHAPAN